jgi:hypothetical protein
MKKVPFDEDNLKMILKLAFFMFMKIVIEKVDVLSKMKDIL